MNNLTLPIEGHCRCGAVRMEISAPPVMTAACHCTGCQRMSGSAYSLTAMIPAEGFRVALLQKFSLQDSHGESMGLLVCHDPT